IIFLYVFSCENQCEYGFYGKDCKGKCGCGDGETCESIGGSCSKSDVTSAKTTSTTTPKSVDPPRPPQFDVHVLTTDRITTIPPNVTETIVLRSITVASPGNVSSDDDDDDRPELASIPNGLAITICSGIAAIAIPISAMYVIFVLMRRRTNDTSTDSESKPKSVYHSPLPDPPAYQNQFETEILSSLSAKGCMDLLYDHPPSTGSYRAAAIPEPESSEPLYDEIPCWNNPIVPEETHYANTDNEGNTRL
ncbi:PREDICTED: uncharacterized protein LOC108562081, partial [Nicrophorus vespilloides]|uniref:Uncharacterized protein LOC108562081 n=1 Tax=Nicrophorus vespilloides TaxID=110193 RepID=A0ABM1MMH5_NICVS